MFSQQFSTGDVKDSDNARVEATTKDLLTGMEGNRARAIFRHKIVQLNAENSRYIENSLPELSNVKGIFVWEQTYIIAFKRQQADEAYSLQMFTF